MAVSSATAKLLNLNHRQYLWIYGIAKVVGTDQLCVGQTSASEVRVIHTLDDIFREDSTEGVLLKCHSLSHGLHVTHPHYIPVT